MEYNWVRYYGHNVTCSGWSPDPSFCDSSDECLDSSTWELAMPCSGEGKFGSKVSRFLFWIYNSYSNTWVRYGHSNHICWCTCSGMSSLKPLGAKWCILQTLPLLNHHFDIWYQFGSVEVTGFVSFFVTDVSLMVPNQDCWGRQEGISQC
jgi:hypothetical protein